MDFDHIIERRETHSMKWDMMAPLFGIDSQDGLPMWVADMDFRPPQAVQDALQSALNTGVYGYYGDDRSYRDAIIWWMKTRHGWAIDPDWILTTPGLVNATAMVIDALTAPGDGVVVLSPVYHAFYRVIRGQAREVIECELAIDDGKYVLDIEAWDQQMRGHEKLLILCSPHNPGGRVWREDELQDIARFAERHGLIVLSDEIHHDLVYPEHRFMPFAKLPDDFANKTITLTSSSKSFNLAGGHTGNIIVSNTALREALAKKLAAMGLSTPNMFGMIMAEAAYSPNGATWMDALVDYLTENKRLFDQTIASIPGLTSMPLEATYLAWVGFENTGLTVSDMKERVHGSARLATNLGSEFGKGGGHFMRFNFAMPRPRLKEACDRLQTAFADLQ